MHGEAQVAQGSPSSLCEHDNIDIHCKSSRL